MRKRIYLNFIALTLSALLLLTAVLCYFYYDAFQNREMSAVRDSAHMVSDLLNRGGTAERLLDYDAGGSLRVTVIAPDGRVLLDNMADAATLENHSQREEVAGAARNGTGEATRYSGTIAAETYYYAIRLDSGNVLRLSKTIESIARLFTASLPSVIVVAIVLMIAANFLAHKLTDHILRPLIRIDLESDNPVVYDELAPYAKKIDSQKREIAGQIAALQRRAGMIEAIIGNMREGLLLLDQSAIVVTANKSAADIFGEVHLAGQNILHICRDIGFQQGTRRCLSGENEELQLERGDKIYGVYCSPVPGGEGGAVILLLDITEKQEAERQRREFSANVSHELKTPLTSISALSEMIENGMAKEADVKTFAARISEQAGRLIGIIEDIIRLSEFDEGGVRAETTELDLYELAQSVIHSLRGKDRGIPVSLSGEHVTLSVNHRMLDELLYNLIDNAIKYNKENGSVSVCIEKEAGFCKISVSDTGIGIPREDHSRVFERFYRVDKSRSKKTGGTGLGLSIVKHIAAYHGGRVELESVPGEGTTVTCYIAMQA